MKFGNTVVKHRRIIRIAALVLLIPSVLGVFATRINYDMLDSIMDEIKPNQKDKLVLRDQETIAQIPAGIPEYRREEYVAKALRLFRKIGGK